MSQSIIIKYNRHQNHLDFELEPIINQAPLFKFQYLKKTLNPIQEDPDNMRICIIKCLIKGCR